MIKCPVCKSTSVVHVPGKCRRCRHYPLQALRDLLDSFYEPSKRAKHRQSSNLTLEDELY